MAEISPNPIKVMIVDDHLLVREGIHLLLSTYEEISVVALANNGSQAVALCSENPPDVILMDIVMPEMDGPTATALILKDHPQTKVIALTSFMEDELVHQAVEAGAIGYLLKNVSADKLVETIKNAHLGQASIDAQAAQALLRAAQVTPTLGSDLTDRELDVLTLLVQGNTNKKIAKKLVLSPGTVRVYVSSILAKLGASNRTEAAHLAMEHNIVPIDEP